MQILQLIYALVAQKVFESRAYLGTLTRGLATALDSKLIFILF